MIQRPPGATRTDTFFPYPTPFRSMGTAPANTNSLTFSVRPAGCCSRRSGIPACASLRRASKAVTTRTTVASAATLSSLREVWVLPARRSPRERAAAPEAPEEEAKGTTSLRGAAARYGGQIGRAPVGARVGRNVNIAVVDV